MNFPSITIQYFYFPAAGKKCRWFLINPIVRRKCMSECIDAMGTTNANSEHASHVSSYYYTTESKPSLHKHTIRPWSPNKGKSLRVWRSGGCWRNRYKIDTVFIAAAAAGWWWRRSTEAAREINLLMMLACSSSSIALSYYCNMIKGRFRQTIVPSAKVKSSKGFDSLLSHTLLITNQSRSDFFLLKGNIFYYISYIFLSGS